MLSRLRAQLQVGTLLKPSGDNGGKRIKLEGSSDDEGDYSAGSDNSDDESNRGLTLLADMSDAPPTVIMDHDDSDIEEEEIDFDDDVPKSDPSDSSGASNNTRRKSPSATGVSREPIGTMRQRIKAAAAIANRTSDEDFAEDDITAYQRELPSPPYSPPYASTGAANIPDESFDIFEPASPSPADIGPKNPPEDPDHEYVQYPPVHGYCRNFFQRLAYRTKRVFHPADDIRPYTAPSPDEIALNYNMSTNDKDIATKVINIVLCDKDKRAPYVDPTMSDYDIPATWMSRSDIVTELPRLLLDKWVKSKNADTLSDAVPYNKTSLGTRVAILIADLSNPTTERWALLIRSTSLSNSAAGVVNVRWYIIDPALELPRKSNRVAVPTLPHGGLADKRDKLHILLDLAVQHTENTLYRLVGMNKSVKSSLSHLGASVASSVTRVRRMDDNNKGLLTLVHVPVITGSSDMRELTTINRYITHDYLRRITIGAFVRLCHAWQTKSGRVHIPSLFSPTENGNVVYPYYKLGYTFSRSDGILIQSRKLHANAIRAAWKGSRPDVYPRDLAPSDFMEAYVDPMEYTDDEAHDDPFQNAQLYIPPSLPAIEVYPEVKPRSLSVETLNALTDTDQISYNTDQARKAAVYGPIQVASESLDDSPYQPPSDSDLELPGYIHPVTTIEMGMYQ